jgi:hypothetical protein
MFERTVGLLHSDRSLQYADSCFSFGYGRNALGTATKEAMLAFFGPAFFVTSINGTGRRELVVTSDAIREVDGGDAFRAIVQLLKNDFRMFSVASITEAALEQLASTFLAEMGESRTYSNTHIYPASHKGECLGPWTPVTRSAKDTLVCSVNEECVAYWVYSDDE